MEIPDDMRIRAIDPKYFQRNYDDPTFAEYHYMGKHEDPDELVYWDDFYHDEFDEIPVRLSGKILSSDEAIVAVLAHEMHELNSLRRLFEENGGAMRAGYLYRLITPGNSGNLHDQAWDVADRLVRRMRESTPSSK